jgi:hypothetical protein
MMPPKLVRTAQAAGTAFALATSAMPAFAGKLEDNDPLDQLNRKNWEEFAEVNRINLSNAFRFASSADARAKINNQMTYYVKSFANSTRFCDLMPIPEKFIRPTPHEVRLLSEPIEDVSHAKGIEYLEVWDRADFKREIGSWTTEKQRIEALSVKDTGAGLCALIKWLHTNVPDSFPSKYQSHKSFQDWHSRVEFTQDELSQIARLPVWDTDPTLMNAQRTHLLHGLTLKEIPNSEVDKMISRGNLLSESGDRWDLLAVYIYRDMVGADPMFLQKNFDAAKTLRDNRLAQESKWQDKPEEKTLWEMVKNSPVWSTGIIAGLSTLIFLGWRKLRK